MKKLDFYPWFLVKSPQNEVISYNHLKHLNHLTLRWFLYYNYWKINIIEVMTFEWPLNDLLHPQMTSDHKK